jgi:hypothetical protein
MTDTFSKILLVPSDPLNTRVVDDHFKRDTISARDLGWDVAVVDFDALVQGRHFKLRPAVDRQLLGLYRGWMLSPASYEHLHLIAQTSNIRLLTDPVAYEKGHMLPCWYETMRPFTPRTVELHGSSTEKIRKALTQLGGDAAVVRGYGKSLKHHWNEACFIPDTSDLLAAEKVIGRFIELSADSDFTQGVLLREYEHFVGGEVRTWWVNGQHVLTTPHPDSASDVFEVDLVLPDAFSASMCELGLTFATADFVRDSAGQVRLVEIGDGQVSDLPPSTDPALLLKRF